MSSRVVRWGRGCVVVALSSVIAGAVGCVYVDPTRSGVLCPSTTQINGQGCLLSTGFAAIAMGGVS